MRCVPLVLLVACGSSKAKQPDAAPIVDAPPDIAIDAEIDAPVDAPPVGNGAHYHYILDSLLWPTSSSEYRAYAFDLNGDGYPDNQVGAFGVAMRTQGGIDVQSTQTQAIDHGTVLMLADLQAMDLTTATGAGYTMYVGANPNPAPCNGSADTTCRHHLTGTGSFDAASTPRDPQLIGVIVNGVFVGSPGHLEIQLSVGGGTPTLYTLLDAHAGFTPTSTTLAQGKIGGAIAQADVANKIVPGLHDTAAAVVTRDCTMLGSPPGCGCLSGSAGATAISFYDTNHDCTVTLGEVQNNYLVMSLLQPDVTVEGQMALSVGVAVTAVGATFTP